MIKKKIVKYIALLVVFVCLLGFFPQPSFAQTSDTSPKAQYIEAVEDAGLVETVEESNQLIPITTETPLVWNDDHTKIAVVTWKSKMSYESFIKPYTNTSTNENYLTWVTVVPQMKDFAKQYLKENPNATAADLELRLKQFLGLDPNWTYDVFVELWVKPDDLFRPCVDPEISDRQCNQDFGSVIPIVKGATEGASIKNYELFYKNLFYKSIRSGMQPWTGLGYTYDWGNPNSEVGASEFIIIPGAAYTVKQVVPTLEYLNFNK